MANAIKLKRSSVAGKAPQPADLAYGELAVNTADIALYTKTTGGTVTAINSWNNIRDKPELALSTIVELSSDPILADIPAGTWALFKNTTTGTISLWANNSGTLVKVMLT